MLVSHSSSEPMDWYTRDVLVRGGVDPDMVREWRWEGSTLHVRLGVEPEMVNISVSRVPLPRESDSP